MPLGVSIFHRHQQVLGRGGEMILPWICLLVVEPGLPSQLVGCCVRDGLISPKLRVRSRRYSTSGRHQSCRLPTTADVVSLGLSAMVLQRYWATRLIVTFYFLASSGKEARDTVIHLSVRSNFHWAHFIDTSVKMRQSNRKLRPKCNWKLYSIVHIALGTSIHHKTVSGQLQS